MPGEHHVFISYSSADRPAAALVHQQLTQLGLSIFWDVESLRAGDLWLERLQQEVDGCGAFVLLVGRDGVRRWVGAEAQVALSRYLGPHEDTERLPIFPVLLDGSAPETLPAFLRLFQATHWNGEGPLPETLIASIRDKRIVADKTARFEGCPFVGLAAYRPEQAHLFFGRQKETLDALGCFETRNGRAPVRWLEINGNSGSGKSSLMNAGLLPLIERGWLWPRTGYERWTRIGPMMPGMRPVARLAEVLARTWQVEMADVNARLNADGDAALAHWLRTRKQDDTAFLLAVDQFEELFTFADTDERRRFDALLTTALADSECPLFVLSTVRADFLDRFAENLPRLAAVQNRLGRSWKLGPVGSEALREVIDGPARLAGLDASEVREAMVAEVRDEPGALPLVENALEWLWDKRQGNRLSGRLLGDRGGLAGILSSRADDLLNGLDKGERARALELLFHLVQVDPEVRRHTRRRITLTEAIAVAGGGEAGRAVINRLSGQRRPDGGKAAGPLRLITVGEDGAVNLIHETLMRSKGLDADGKPQPYWPALWTYIERNAKRAARRERLKLTAREWKERKGLSRLSGLAGWSSLFGFRGLATPGTDEHRYLAWSRGRAAFEVASLVTILSATGESLYWAHAHDLPLQAIWSRWTYKSDFEDVPLPRLVKIPNDSSAFGAFLMGSEKAESEKPVHRVVFGQQFYIARTEVSFEQYDAFCEATGRTRPSDAGWGRGTRAVINVAWEDAHDFARWLGAMTGGSCRLPSEAEWEFAARAGTTTAYALPAPNGGDDLSTDIEEPLANCADCGSRWDAKETAPVGQFPANAWGLQDTHGNVWEWVEDCWHGSYRGAPEDGRAWLESEEGDCFKRVLRGGSWNSYHDYVRSATRLGLPPNTRNNLIGFRVVCASSLNYDR